MLFCKQRRVFYVTADDISAGTLTPFDKELRRGGHRLSPVPAAALISPSTNYLHEEKEPRGCVGAAKAPEARSGPLVVTPHACRRGGGAVSGVPCDVSGQLARGDGETWMHAGPRFQSLLATWSPVKTSRRVVLYKHRDMRDERPQRCGTPPCFTSPPEHITQSRSSEVVGQEPVHTSTISRGSFHLMEPSDPRAHVSFSEKKIPSH